MDLFSSLGEILIKRFLFYEGIPFLLIYFVFVPIVISSPVPDSLVYIEPIKNTEYIILVEKSTQQMFVYAYDGSFKEVDRFKCSTGENSGSKAQSGDRRTPEGIYFFNKAFIKKELSPIYGSRAFPTDYPNFIDRFAGKNGHAIWIHGTNKPLKPMDTNGCVAMVNKDINKLANYITLNRTPVIIKKKLSFIPLFDSDSSDARSLRSFLSGFEKSLTEAKKEDIIKLYTNIYEPDLSWRPLWTEIKEKLKSSCSYFSLKFKNILLLKQDKIYVALFDQFVSAGKDKNHKQRLAGRHKLFLVKNKQNWQILGDEYLKIPVNSDNNEHPLLIAAKALNNDLNFNIIITEMVDGWIKAWKSKDIDQYGQYYSSDFMAQGKNLNSWLKYKKKLNNIYKFISISRKELKIKPGYNTAKVSFEQTYVSSGYKAVGIKFLILKRIGEKWKIYREIWKKM
ncbi:Secreted protein containing YkuD domain protein [Candidatus Magnetomoraceae bacterium gMMP-1]